SFMTEQTTSVYSLMTTLPTYPFAKDGIIEVVVEHVAPFGLFCLHRNYRVLLLIPYISWIASFGDCRQFASVGDRFYVRVIMIPEDERPPYVSLCYAYPAHNPWGEMWTLREGDELEARVVRYVEQADRCKDAPGFLLELRP